MIPGAIILLYHRVIALDRDPQLLCVSPENFKSQIDWISNRYHIVPLARIGQALAEGRPLKDMVAITFDDGYFDNFQIAAPILRAANCPATIFATTGLTNTSREFFWDDLDRIFLAPGTLPKTFAPLDIDLGDSAAHDGRFANWTVLDSVDPTPRQATYRRLATRLHESPIAQRHAVLQELQAWSNVPARETHRMMTSSELENFLFPRPRDTGGGSEGGLITLGGHTVNHCRLSAESLEVQASQIQQNRESLGLPSTFSYPFGTRHDYTAETVELVKQAGYELACANFGGTVTLESDPCRLPRHIVRDWPIEQFVDEFTKWSGQKEPRTK